MSSMVRIHPAYVYLQRNRPPRVSLCRRGPSLSLLFVTIGIASLGFLVLTEVAMMQRRAVSMPSRAVGKMNQPASGTIKKPTYPPPNRADPFKIEPLLRRNSLSVELSAQVRINALASDRIGRDIKKYYLLAKCNQQQKEDINTTSCQNFTITTEVIISKWWEKPYCPPYPTNLIPPRTLNNRLTIKLSHLEGCTSRVAAGGSWTPETCLPRHSVAIVIPYRDRWRHLTTLMNHLHPLLQRQQVKYRIFVVEQYGNETFNKGTIMNAAFLEALQDELYHCFIFHDVDLIPETDYNMYTCPQMPRHMSVAVNELNYRLPYHILVGGVLAIRTEHFFKVNGYSNLFWGWGGEDDDMGMRIQQSGLQITRPLASIGRYTMIKHIKRSGIELRVRSKLVRTAKRRYRLDGLNTVQYRLLSKTENPWFTSLLIDLGSPPPGLTTK